MKSQKEIEDRIDMLSEYINPDIDTDRHIAGFVDGLMWVLMSSEEKEKQDKA